MDSATELPVSAGKRSYFWLGFVVGFLLLTLASCGGVALLFGFDSLRLADLQGEPIWTPPPLAAPAPAAAAVVDSSRVAGVYLPGDRVRNITVSRVNVRRSPGYLGKPAEDIVAQIGPGQLLTVVNGPAGADGLVWWQVDLGGSAAAVGWVAQATASGVQILEREP